MMNILSSGVASIHGAVVCKAQKGHAHFLPCKVIKILSHAVSICNAAQKNPRPVRPFPDRPGQSSAVVHGQFHRENGALTRPAFPPDASAGQFHNPLRQGKPQTVSLGGVGRAGGARNVSLIKFIKNALLGGLVHADAAVGNLSPPRWFLPSGRKPPVCPRGLKTSRRCR